MSQLYDIFFAAQLVDGFDEADVRDNLAKLFKANDATLEKLFSGKPQLIKRGIDKAGALKYKAALQNAGAIALVRAQPGAAPAAEPTPAPAPSYDDDDLPSSSDIKPTAAVAPQDGQSMADRIASLAAEPSASAFGEAMTLAPAGSDVLRDEERHTIEELDIDTSAIQLAPETSEPTAPAAPAPPPPDTDHLSMGEVGEDIPHLETTTQAVNPDTSHLSMGEVGEDIPHLEEQKPTVTPDTSGISLAPEGSEVLAENDRKKPVAAPPNTDHIALADD
jgi:hypothetical protein